MTSAMNATKYSLSSKYIRGGYGVCLVAISCIIIHPKCTVLSLETEVKGFQIQKEQTGGILGVERGMQTLGNMSKTHKKINVREKIGYRQLCRHYQYTFFLQ